MEEITPGIASAVTGIGQEGIAPGQVLDYGFSGISVSRQTPGMLTATTIVKDDGDSVFVSMDYGDSWRRYCMIWQKVRSRSVRLICARSATADIP